MNGLPPCPELAGERGQARKICFQEADSQQYAQTISQALLRQLNAFCVRYQVGEFAALFALLVWQLRDHELESPATLLFFTNGRSRVQPINTLGYFSFLMPYVVERKEEALSFPVFVRQVEKALAKLRQQEQGFLRLYRQDTYQEMIAQSAIFDYQKLYASGSEAIWSKMRCFECNGVQNPFSFRIFDYGERAELSVLYRRSAFDLGEAGVARLVRTYIKQWNELFQEPNDLELC